MNEFYSKYNTISDLNILIKNEKDSGIIFKNTPRYIDNVVL